MASVNFEKYKTSQEVKAMLRHCDMDERKQHNHSNQNINKTLTGENVQAWDYDTACGLYDTRIAKLDAKPGANIRKDRVTCFGLSIPVPEGMDETDYRDWTVDTLELIIEQYGDENLIGAYLHLDEIHDYKDAETGEDRTSRAHIHAYVVPEVNGKLNGRAFSSKKNMIKLNQAIHKMTQTRYGLDFMDGSKKKSTEEMVTLKHKSKLQKIAEKEKIADKLIEKNQSDNAILSMQFDLLRRKQEDLEEERKQFYEEKADLEEEKRQFQEDRKKFDKEKAEFQRQEDALEAQKSILNNKLDECMGIYSKLSEKAKYDVRGAFEKMLDMKNKADQEDVMRNLGNTATWEDVMPPGR